MNFKRSVVVSTLLILLTSTSLFAKPKQKLYNNQAQEVFQAALKTARERHVITYVDEKNLMFTFQTGASVLSEGFVANASIEPQPDGKAKLLINVQHKNTGQSGGPSFGAGDRMADKFFDQVTQELANKSTQPVAVKPEAAHVEVPPNLVATSTPDANGTVMVVSTPDGAEISVDGSFSGNTPSTVKLAPGKHTFTVTQAGFTAWSRDLSITAGSELRLNAVLEKQP